MRRQSQDEDDTPVPARGKGVAFPDAHRYQEYRRVRGSKKQATVNDLKPCREGNSLAKPGA
jgi:hypothetical protein